MFAAVLICYALVLQSLLGSLAMASPRTDDASAFLTIICHATDTSDDQQSPAKDIQAKHHCVLCQAGALQAAMPAPSPETTLSLVDRRAAVVAYARRQDPATAPLYLPPRQSRGPPLTA